MGEITGYIIMTVAGYLSGSVMYAYLLPKVLRHVDVIALSEDKNPGAANAVKFAGFPIGFVSLFCDIAKAYMPVIIAVRVLDTRNLMFAAVMAAPIAGHMFSPWLKFRGGKSIAASFGVMIALAPRVPLLWILVAYYLLFTLAIVIKPTSLRTIITYVMFSLTAVLLLGYNSYTLGAVIIGAMVSVKHVVRLGHIRARIKLFAPNFTDKDEPDRVKENK